jgi:hypothetical protein
MKKLLVAILVIIAVSSCTTTRTGCPGQSRPKHTQFGYGW